MNHLAATCRDPSPGAAYANEYPSPLSGSDNERGNGDKVSSHYTVGAHTRLQGILSHMRESSKTAGEKMCTNIYMCVCVLPDGYT